MGRLWMFLAICFDGLARVFDQIGKGLPDHGCVNLGPNLAFGLCQGDLNLRLTCALKGHNPLQQLGDILTAAAWFRHTRKARELIHNMGQIIGLAHDHIGQLFQALTVFFGQNLGKFTRRTFR